jgi:hypothetical protein
MEHPLLEAAEEVSRKGLAPPGFKQGFQRKVAETQRREDGISFFPRLVPGAGDRSFFLDDPAFE